MSVPAAVDPHVAATEGLPRRNGELVFEAPWEARAFGVAVAFCREHGLDWEQFRQRLIAEVAAAEGGERPYWEQWVASLERLVLDHGLVSARELDARVERVAHELAHDHDHDDDDDHHHHHH